MAERVIGEYLEVESKLAKDYDYQDLILWSVSWQNRMGPLIECILQDHSQVIKQLRKAFPKVFLSRDRKPQACWG
jgi:hypothetical protein